MSIIRHTVTTEMQVTSIRFEQELKNRLKQLAGHQGYQALIRNILWDYVNQKSRAQSQVFQSDIRASMPAKALQEEHCALTGKVIQPQEPMLLGLMNSGEMVPLSVESLPS